mmetsp:Transcript_12433/g.16645  ORF Transcript_12433/g.16645 Transcript_12433/m.16645 type:complete len:152 (+) Transcript_12433:99-554(+)
MIEVLDTAGQEEFKAQRDEWIRDSDGFLVMFSITSRNSFNQVDEFLDTIARVKEGDDCPVLVLGNKCDLEDKRQVSTSEAESKFNHIYMETSAKTRTNIQEAMERIVSMFISGENSIPFNTNIKGAVSRSRVAQRQRANSFADLSDDDPLR